MGLVFRFWITVEIIFLSRLFLLAVVKIIIQLLIVACISRLDSILKYKRININNFDLFFTDTNFVIVRIP